MEVNNKNQKIEVILRLIIRRGNEILLTKNKSEGFFFFPGGHLEFGETVEEGIQRELREELDTKAKSHEFVGAVENIFEEEGETHHEINLVFKAEIEDPHDNSQEDHIDFHFKPIGELKDINMLPETLKEQIMEWFEDRKCFWKNT